MITLTNINKSYRTNEIETLALDSVSLTVEKGEFVSIMGPSGCGKSTLLNIVGLLDKPTKGIVKIQDIDISKMNHREAAAFRNKSLSFVFQNFHLISSLNVMEKCCYCTCHCWTARLYKGE